ncbi:MAG: ribosome silencing factor [Vicinamibacterales bacterium]
MTKTTKHSAPRLPLPVRIVIDAMEDKKALDLVVLDLRETEAFTDFFVVASGQSNRQVKAITDAIDLSLKKTGLRPAHMEGYDHAEWVLMDCFDMIVHIFTERTREHYDLERLWGSAKRITVQEAVP